MKKSKIYLISLIIAVTIYAVISLVLILFIGDFNLKPLFLVVIFWAAVIFANTLANKMFEWQQKETHAILMASVSPAEVAFSAKLKEIQSERKIYYIWHYDGKSCIAFAIVNQIIIEFTNNGYVAFACIDPQSDDDGFNKKYSRIPIDNVFTSNDEAEAELKLLQGIYNE